MEFQYERLPNICYWCGMLTHADKECKAWLKSKGELSVDNQQFGPWLRASQFSLARRQTMEVKGFEMDQSLHQPGRGGGKDGDLTSGNSRAGKEPVQEVRAAVTGEVTDVSGLKSGAISANPEAGVSKKTSQPLQDFEALIKEIDNAINMESQTSNQAEIGIDTVCPNREERRELELVANVDDSQEMGQADIGGGPMETFVLGRSEPKSISKVGQVGRRKINKVGKGADLDSDGPSVNGELKSGCWTRRATRPKQVTTDKDAKEDVGLKRKERKECSSEDVKQEKEKRQKTNEETKKLSVLFATHLGSTEAVEQPRRTQ